MKKQYEKKQEEIKMYEQLVEDYYRLEQEEKYKIKLKEEQAKKEYFKNFLIKANKDAQEARKAQKEE